MNETTVTYSTVLMNGASSARRSQKDVEEHSRLVITGVITRDG